MSSRLLKCVATSCAPSIDLASIWHARGFQKCEQRHTLEWALTERFHHMCSG